MSDLDTLRRIYANWGRGDYSSGIDVFATDVEFVYSSDFPEPATFRGHEGVYEGWGRWLREWDDMRVVLEDLIDLAPQVLAEVIVQGRGKSSGAPLAEPGANLWTFRDGHAVRLEIYTDRAHARRAAGLAT